MKTLSLSNVSQNYWIANGSFVTSSSLITTTALWLNNVSVFSQLVSTTVWNVSDNVITLSACSHNISSNYWSSNSTLDTVSSRKGGKKRVANQSRKKEAGKKRLANQCVYGWRHCIFVRQFCINYSFELITASHASSDVLTIKIK